MDTDIVYNCKHVWTNCKAWVHFITHLNGHVLFALFRDLFKIAPFCQRSKQAEWMTTSNNEDCNGILNILEYWICGCLTSWNNSKVVFFFTFCMYLEKNGWYGNMRSRNFGILSQNFFFLSQNFLLRELSCVEALELVYKTCFSVCLCL